MLLTAFLLTPGVSAARVKIALITPQSGPLAPQGDSAKLGAQLALADLKGELDKADLQVSLEVFDEQNATVAASAAKDIAADPLMLGVLGPTFSGAAMLVSEVLRPARVPMITASATANEITDRAYSNVNRLVARSDAQGAVIAQYLSDDTARRRVLVVSDNTTFGNSLADEFRDGARGKSLTILGRINGPKADFSDILDAVKSNRPDAVFFSGNPDVAINFLKALKAADISLPVVGGSTFEDPGVLRTAIGLGQELTYTTTFGTINRFSAATEFTTRYRAAFDKTPNIFSVFMYDATRTMLAALLDARARANRTPTRTQVAAAVRRVRLTDAVTGSISFNARGDRAVAPLFVMRLAKGSTFPDTLEVHLVRPSR